ncbi:MAG: protein kinase domain-containing protein [Polyangiales bacterium]
MMRATAAKAAGWTTIRPLGARAVPTNAARTTSTPPELVILQTWARGDDDRSLRDARALLSFKHANVAKVREVIEDGGDVRFLTQFVEGETLGALRRAGRIPLAIELRILVDVLTGLAALHALKDAKLKPLGFVHSEVAPANVVIGVDGVARVIQLAGAHAAPGAQGTDTTAHLAPEILLADDAFDQRVDVYGVGVMLWEALSGTPLFKEKATGAIVTSHLSGRIQKATVPPDSEWAAPLIEVAAKAIATDPRGRYASANELAAEIKRVAKTNLAPIAKVATLVKERGTAAIDARRSALGGSEGRTNSGARPKITPKAEVAPPAAKAEEADAGWSLPPPSHEPVSSRDVESVPPADLISIETEEPEDSAIKSRPQPSVHDRITDPNLLIDARALDAAAATEETTLPVAKPAPVVVPVVPKTTMMGIAPPIPKLAPPPVIAKEPEKPAPMAIAPPPIAPIAEPSPSPPVAATPAPLPVIEAPGPMFSPIPEAMSAPVFAGAEPTDASALAERDKRRKRAALIFLACAFLFCVLAIALRSKPKEHEAKVPPKPTAVAKPVETVAKSEPSVPPPAPSPEPAPSVVATAEPPAAPATAESAQKPVEPPAVGNPGVAPPTGKPGSNSKAKPKPTYDPLGI